MSEATPLPGITRSKVSERVYDILKERILSQRFAPGERLNLAKMARQMGVSRTPLSTALHRLATDGLVEIIPNSGTFVADLTPEEIAEAYDVRQVLEVYAGKLAAGRITASQLKRMRGMVNQLGKLVNTKDRATAYQRHIELDHNLHRLIVESAGNEQLKRLWEQVNVYVQAARIRYRRPYGELDLSMKEHSEILKALEARNSAGVQRWLGSHIERSKQALLNDLAEVASS
jgi:DNA-binding GntR family transcriptional regulator